MYRLRVRSPSHRRAGLPRPLFSVSAAVLATAAYARADDLVINNATHILSPGQTLSVTGHEYVGQTAPGTFLQTGGTHSIDNNLYVGLGNTSSGQFSLSGGSLSVGHFVSVAHAGRGTFTHTAGTHDVTDDLYVGYAPGSTGAYSLSGTGSVSVARDLLVANIGIGSFVQTGGSLSVAGTAYHAASTGSRANYSLSAGSLTVPGAEVVGFLGNATFAQSGGTHTVNALTLGYFLGGTGTYLLTGGTLNATSILLYPRGSLSVSAAATLNFSSLAQAGGAVAYAGPFTLAQASYSLSGNASLTVTGDLRVGEPPPAAAMALAGAAASSSTFSLVDSAAATVSGTLYNSPGSAVSLAGGSLTLHNFPSLSPGSAFDFTGGQLRLPYNPANTPSPASQLRDALAAGLISSSNPGSDLSIGYTDSGSTVLAKLTPTGDANLNGTIDPDDFALIDHGFGTNGAHWWRGDFDYDGHVTTADYLLIDQTYLNQVPVFSPGFLSMRESQFGSDYVNNLRASLPEPSVALFSIFYPLPSFFLPRRRPFTRRTSS